MTAPPCLVWLPPDHRMLGEGNDSSPFSVVADQFARAVQQCAGAQPLMFPLAQTAQIADLLALVDGVMLTGSPSNVHPSHFGETVANPALPLDPQRDTLTLALVRACVAHAVPLLGVCRGFQEINVALGGSLHQQVHAVPGRMDHREPAGLSLDAQYALAHMVDFAPGSVFAQWAGGPQARVNSLHGQAVNRLAEGLEALGIAPDGVVEAVGIRNAPAFAYAVQWHPEWDCASHTLNGAIFRAFGDACRLRQRARLSGLASFSMPPVKAGTNQNATRTPP